MLTNSTNFNGVQGGFRAHLGLPNLTNISGEVKMNKGKNSRKCDDERKIDLLERMIRVANKDECLHWPYSHTVIRRDGTQTSPARAALELHTGVNPRVMARVTIGSV